MTDWPILKTYLTGKLNKMALPLGGIGTGTVSLGGRGNLQDWAIMNRPGVGHTPNVPSSNNFSGSFFALHCDRNGEKNSMILEGPIDKSLYESKQGTEVIGAGLPRFEENSFLTSYPLARVQLKDKTVPLDVELEAFNPLVPGDEDQSGIPTAVLRYRLHNPTNDLIKASVCGNLLNFIGSDGSKTGRNVHDKVYGLGAKNGQLEYRKEKNIEGVYLSSDGVDPLDESWGTMAISCQSGNATSYRTGWAPSNWGHELLDFWDDFSEDGHLDDHSPYSSHVVNPGEFPNSPIASLCSSVDIPAGETKTITFMITWHFPNRKTWTPERPNEKSGLDFDKYNTIGNYYCTQYANAWDVAAKTFPNLSVLEKNTVDFVSTVVHSDLPDVFKEAALFNVSTLRTQTCFRTKDGRFFAWEGIHETQGSCHGSCTHVWNYEQTTAHLFPKISQSMRDTEFNHSLRSEGQMAFRVKLPLDMNARGPHIAAADGQMGTLMRFYRDWILSGDNEFLESFWPKIKLALSFCWVKGGWDENATGVMTGAQHNTMDVEYYGPNPQMQSWYLGALVATSHMAESVGDTDFEKKCKDLFNKGRQWMEKHLFNGQYYEHIIQRPDYIHPSTNVYSTTVAPIDPPFQIGKGCLIDQLVGQYMAHICGLGHILDPEQVKTTLKSIMKYNFKDRLQHHFNPMRVYALGDESALLMASYPLGDRPKQPFPYYAEVMTGFEYSTAIHMLYEGLEEEGMRVVEAIRERFDGEKRNPFDEAECGHHYARAMAAWGLILQWTGFHYNGIEKSLKLASRNGTFPWCLGTAWGQYTLTDEGESKVLTVRISKGQLELHHVAIGEWSHAGKLLATEDGGEVMIKLNKE